MDNPAFLHGGVRGTHLVIEVEGDRAGSLRQTLDDLLACIGVAERAGAKEGAGGRGSPRPRAPPS
ncbi:MAG: hypothetical protein L3J93_01420 [Thermoplasmata archaeon]|nr:hypothetical protein [Thermoplasmata archaeon]